MPSAPGDSDGDRDLGALLVRRAGEKYGFCRGKFLLDVPAGCDVIACSALSEADCFNSIIDRYAGDRATLSKGFFSACGTFFFRFLRFILQKPIDVVLFRLQESDKGVLTQVSIGVGAIVKLVQEMMKYVYFS